MLTIEECRARVDEIAEIAKGKRDNEIAHMNEDNLYHAFIHHVATRGSGGLQEMAKEVLKTRTIGFPRRYS